MKQTHKIIFLVIIALAGFNLLFSQSKNDFRYEVESVVSVSGGKSTPLWLTANKQGLSSVDKKNAYLKGSIFYSSQIKKNFSVEGGLELAGAYHYTSDFIIHQLYGDFKYRSFLLSVGSKERYSELKNHLLSTGGMTFSGNARPVPQVRIGTGDYITIPRTKEFFHLRGHIAYGRFTDDKFQKSFALGKSKYNEDVLYHSKAIFWKIGNEKKFPVVFEGGLEMEAQFGGTAYYPTGRVEKSPSRFIDYLKVFVPMSGDEQTNSADQVNVVGNHLGSWHASLKYGFNDWSFRLYYEHFFEDHSQMFWQYGRWKDGFLGGEISFPSNPFISSFVYEFLYTKDQTGPFLHDKTDNVPDQISGNDNYYNHVFYSSWSHWGMGMGNPLIVSPIYNDNGNFSFRSNRIVAHHIGFMGNPVNDLSYRVLFSHAKHWGTYYNPLENVEKVINGFVEVIYKPSCLKSWTFKGALAADKGKLTGNNKGGLFSLQYSW